MKNIEIPIYGKHYNPGYVMFNRSGGFLSEGIVWFESLGESESFISNHVALVIDAYRGIESGERGVEYFALSKYFDDPNVEVVIREPLGLNVKDIQEVLTFAKSQELEEVPYDYTGILGLALGLATRVSDHIKWIRKLPPFMHWPGARVCSAFVSDCFKHTEKYGKEKLFSEYHIARITPLLLWKCFPWKPLKLNS